MRTLIALSDTYDLISCTFAEDLLDLVADLEQIRARYRTNLHHELRTNVRIARKTQSDHHTYESQKHLSSDRRRPYLRGPCAVPDG